MWRQNNFPGNFDSDQSISDEEVRDGDLRDGCVSLAGNTEKEEGLQFQSRFEMITGEDELEYWGKTHNQTHERETDLFAEDEVEMPEFPEEVDFNSFQRDESNPKLDEEGISDDEDIFARSKCSTTSNAKRCHLDGNFGCCHTSKQGVYMCFVSNKKAEPLKHSSKNILSSCFANSSATKFHKGIRGKAKLRFSIHPYSCGEQASFTAKDDTASKTDGVSELLERAIECKTAENSNPEEAKSSRVGVGEVRAPQDGSIEHSVAKLLDGFQEKMIQHRGDSKAHGRSKERRGQTSVKRTKPLLGDRVLEDVEQNEPVASISSSDDEANHNSPKPINTDVRRQTMTDRFQEALVAGTSSSNEPVLNPSSTGLFAKLQKVMQREKQRDAGFQKTLLMGSVPYCEPSSIIVKILSRYLDAKLIVCQCSLGKVEGSRWVEGSQATEDGGRCKTKIVIFSTRVCDNVDLEVGYYVCIYPPWKEVQDVDNYGSIILATYFSQVLL